MQNPADIVKLRAQAASSIRQFFAERNVLEVMSPVLTPYGVTDPHLHSIEIDQAYSQASPSQRVFLRTSPEYVHKRLLSSGVGDLYELGPVFRGHESGRHHRNEFWMLEWYRLNWSWRQLADEVIELIRRLSPARDWTVEFRSWLSISEQDLGIDANSASLCALKSALDERLDAAPQALDHAELLDWWFASQVQPSFQAETLTVVYDYPASQAALARLKPDQPNWAERFEVFAGPLELANGYGELTEPDEQQRRFKLDNQRRKTLGLPQMPIDRTLLDAMQIGLPNCAGVAMGFERLLMAIFAMHTIDAACYP